MLGLVAATCITGAVLSASGEVLGPSSDPPDIETPLIETEVPERGPILALAKADGHDRAELAGLHVSAIARRNALRDRPVHDSIYVVAQPGESATSIRRRWDLRQEQLDALNPGVDIHNLEDGTEVLVWVHDAEIAARSQLRANRGRLINGELMPTSDRWVVRDERLAFGAVQTIDGLLHALRVTMAEHPGGQEMLIADISARTGGRLSPHHSHQSGRDVDLTYFRLTTDPPTFSRTRPENLDALRTWTFIRTLLTQHDIVYIFMPRNLQMVLFEHAESIGEHPAWLAQVFQYGSRGHRNSHAIIRYAPGHQDHFHVRFGCTEADLRCR